MESPSAIDVNSKTSWGGEHTQQQQQKNNDKKNDSDMYNVHYASIRTVQIENSSHKNNSMEERASEKNEFKYFS